MSWKHVSPPGRMIDIGTRRLHLLCRGNALGGPTVLIETGSGDDSLSWLPVLDQVASFGNVCVYDRAGSGWSDPAPLPRTFEERAADIERLVDSVPLVPPFILVAHSYGAYLMRLFAQRRRTDIAGMVLVDGSEEGYAFGSDQLQTVARRRRKYTWLGVAARLSVLRLVAGVFPDRFNTLVGIPPHSAGPEALYLRPDRYFAIADEMAAYEKVPLAMRRPEGFGSLGTLPLTVISRAARSPVTGQATSEEWLDAQKRLLTLSTNSSLVVAERSGHNIHESEPQLIADVIHRMWNKWA